MGFLAPKPQKPDTSHLDAAEARAKKTELETKKKNKSALAALAAGSRFRLYGPGGERGIRDNLG